ncbi:MAG: hypothetical protein HS113_14105 [Verrucomicrobiales bacterium]|nr:hypothetical protein [Verrucomicrobiales bacterium]
MNSRQTTLLSLGLNVALLAAWGWLLTRPAARTIPAPTTSAAPSPATPSPFASATADPTPPPPVPLPDVPFHWSELASTNFFLYRDRLRAAGCPEPTLRVILESEIAAHFAERRRPFVAALQPRFWTALSSPSDDAFESIEQEFSPLKEAQQRLIDEVLSNARPDRAAESSDRRRGFEQRFEWAPPELRPRLVELEERLWQQEQALQAEVAQRPDPHWTPADHARRLELHETHQREQREWLGVWAGEFELRQSNAAQWTQNLVGFEVTEAEWRTVAQTLKSTDANPHDPAQLADTIQATLGPDRHAEYLQASDGDYQQTRRVTRRLGLSDDTAQEAREIQRAAQAAAAQLRGQISLDADRQHHALAEVAAEAARALHATLGDRGWSVYREYAGAWLKDLTPAPGN